MGAGEVDMALPSMVKEVSEETAGFKGSDDVFDGWDNDVPAAAERLASGMVLSENADCVAVTDAGP